MSVQYLEIPIENIVLLDKNPRNITAEELQKLCNDIENDPMFLEQRPPLINMVNGVFYCYAGTQRIKACKIIKQNKVKCFVEENVAERIQDERMLKDNLHRGEWDYDKLMNLDFQPLELESFGFDDLDIGLGGFDSNELEEEKPNNYSRKIEAPIYQVKDKKPEIKELYDQDKYNSLIAKINESDLDQEYKDFLISAAGRHTVFNYRKIADFYAHSSPEVQELMEESALVIIDFNKAIENGFIHLTEELKEAYGHEG